MIWEMILEKICYTADRSTTKKAVQKPEMKWRKAYEINNIRNRKCNGNQFISLVIGQGIVIL